jgi:GGDEF domain-containing protein
MRIFNRRSTPGEPRRSGAELTEEMRSRLAPHFEAVGEALAAATSSVQACWVVGRAQAELGSSLGESLEGLRATTQLVAGRDPSFEESHALSLAWSESVLGYLHGLSCADPLTGLSTHAHIRERIGELYRHAVADMSSVSRSHALVVTDVGDTLDPVSAARRLTLLGQAARTVFSGSETIGQIGQNKVVVVAPRNERLADRVSLLRRMVVREASRVWIEGLPGSDASAVSLLDELARA